MRIAALLSAWNGPVPFERSGSMKILAATSRPTKFLAAVVALSLPTGCRAGHEVTRNADVRTEADASPGGDVTAAKGEEVASDDRDSGDDPAANDAGLDSAAAPVGSGAPTGPPLPSVADAPGEIVLYNPETNGPSHLPPNSNVIWGNTLSAEEKRRVVDALFTGKHLADQQKCPDEVYAMSAKDQRAHGDFRPFVSQMVAGAFTAPHASEKLYLVQAGECDVPESCRLEMRTELAVLRSNTLVGRVPIGATDGILLASDLDGDGRDEILISSSEGRQGSYFESVEVVRMDASRVTTLKRSTTVVDGSQCAFSEEKGEYSSILYVTRGPHPRFRVETSNRPCHGHGY